MWISHVDITSDMKVALYCKLPNFCLNHVVDTGSTWDLLTRKSLMYLLTVIARTG